MMKPLGMRPDSLNRVGFHYLHVIDVVKQFDVGAVNRLKAPSGGIAHVTRMFLFVVLRLHANRQAVIGGDGGKALQAEDRVAQTASAIQIRKHRTRERNNTVIPAFCASGPYCRRAASNLS